MAKRFPNIFILIALLFISTISGTWSREFSTRGEPREALVAQSMVNSHKWILPEGYGGVVPSKPPMTHWLISLASQWEGEVTEGSSRLPAVLLAALTVLTFYCVTKKLSGNEHALWTAIILLSSFEWVRAATAARVDMILSSFFVLGLLALFTWEEKKSSKWFVLAIVLLTGATLAKGPVSIVLPAGIFGLYLLTEGHSVIASICRSLVVWIPVFLLSLIWYVLAYRERGDAFFSKIWYENFQRFSSTMEDEPHKHGFGYLLGMLVLGFLPWSLALFGYLPAGKKLLSNKLNGTLSALKKWWLSESSYTHFMVITSLCTVIFFSIPSSKRSVYLLPAYPAMAYLLSKLLLSKKERAAKAFSIIFSLIAVIVILATPLIFLVLFDVAPLLHYVIKDPTTLISFREVLQFARKVTTPLQIIITLFPALFVVGIILAKRMVSAGRLSDYNTIILGTLFALACMVYEGGIGVAFTHALSPKQFAITNQVFLSEPKRLFSYRTDFYALSFYLKRRIDIFEPSLIKSGDYIFLLERDLPSLSHEIPFHPVLRSENPIGDPGQHIVVVERSSE